jgi:hypothetical protein
MSCEDHDLQSGRYQNVKESEDVDALACLNEKLKEHINVKMAHRGKHRL